MRDLETVLCREHNRSQPRYPRFKLCPECRADVPREAVVVEAVVNYFSKPEFREFFIETEHKIQMGSDPRRADIVLIDKEGYFIAIAECKKINDVTYGREQLKSYLCATDTQFGIFANKKNPDEWEFYENLRRNRFTPSMERFLFERKIARERTIESIREEKNRLDREAGQARIQHTQKIREVESSDERLEDLNQKIRQANDQFADLKEKINSLGEKERKNYNDYLKQINANLERSINHKTRMIRDIDRLSRLDELEEAFAYESIQGQFQREFERLSELESEIARKQHLVVCHL